METLILGEKSLKVSRVGFGALPIQKVFIKNAVTILNAALDRCKKSN